MKTSRTLLTLALLVGASQSQAMWSRFAKPFTSRFTTALKNSSLRSATALGGGLTLMGDANLRLADYIRKNLL